MAVVWGEMCADETKMAALGKDQDGPADGGRS